MKETRIGPTGSVQTGLKEGQMIQPSVLYHVSFEHSPTGNMLHFPPNDTIPTQLNSQLHHYYNTIQSRVNDRVITVIVHSSMHL